MAVDNKKEQERDANILVFATPIYYYEMSGQMKTLLDRMNPLYPSDYKFRKVYILAVAAEDEDYVPEKAVNGLQGWVDCFEKAELAGSLFCGGISDPDEAAEKKKNLRKHITSERYYDAVTGRKKNDITGITNIFYRE